ncbi:MAG TPA: hydrogenase subunit MbhD domain-containing protein [Solirubrobacteraceae bacterium]|nr:hydrogenase subunit MbhD domain-containing protein [Solirubrobacteraceae bacterium]
MNALLIVLLTLLGGVGWLTVTTREPTRQAVVAGILGLLLALLFFALQAPDVAFSELVVGSAAVPALLLLTIAKIREQQVAARGQEPAGEAGSGTSGSQGGEES